METQPFMPKGPLTGAFAFYYLGSVYLVALARLEHAANGLGNRCSIHLSYRAIPDRLIM